MWLYSALSYSLGKLSELKSSASNQNQNQYSNHGHHHHSHSSNLSSASASSSLTSSNLNSSSNEYLSILEKTREMLTFISSNSFIQSLFHVGKLEDPAIYAQLVSKVAEVENKLNSSGLSNSISLHLANNKEVIDIFINFLTLTEWNNRDPTLVAAQQIKKEVKDAPVSCYDLESEVFRSLNAVLAFDAILNPANDVDVCAKQIGLVAQFNNLTLPDLFCEIMRACFIGLIDSSGEDLKWAAFTFLKVPQLFGKLNFIGTEKGSINSDLEAGLEKFLAYAPLLDLTDSRSNCDCLDLFLKELCKTDLTLEQKNKIMHLRHKDSTQKSERFIKPDQGQGGQGASLILRAEPTVTSILKTLDSDYSKNQDGLLGVLSHMVPGKSFELILNAAAATGKLKSFTHKLIKFNEFNKQASGEGGKASQTRALLFDITFLMLCHIAQNYGTDIVTSNAETKDSFFGTWCSQALSENGHYHSPDSIVANCDPNKVELLLNQFTSSDFELKTSLVKWHEVCQNAPAAVKEVLLAWQHDTLSTDEVKNILDKVKSKMCCLPVVVSAWLCSYVDILHHDKRLKPMNMLSQFMTPLSSDAHSNQASGTFGPGSATSATGSNNLSNNPSIQDQANTYYKERSTLMSSIIKKMLYDLHPPHQSKTKTPLSFVSHGLTLETPLWEIIESNFFSAHNRSWLYTKDVHTMNTLLNVGGPNWFVESLIRQLLKFEEANDLNKAVDFIFGLFHLNIEQCSLCLLINALTNLLLSEDRQEYLIEPRASALARLTVMTIYSALSEMEERKNGKIKTGIKKFTHLNDVITDFEALETNQKIFDSPLDNESSRPAKMMRRSESQTNLSILDNTPFMFSISQYQQSINLSILNEPLIKGIINLLQLFATIINDSNISQKTLFPLAFLQQLVLCTKQDSQKILQFLPFQTIIGMVKLMPSDVNYEFILAISNLQTAKARKIIARTLCQLKRAKKFSQT